MPDFTDMLSKAKAMQTKMKEAQDIIKNIEVEGESGGNLVYHCRICFKPYNNCCCYCGVCKTYLKFCQQIYYDELSTYEDELKMITALGF